MDEEERCEKLRKYLKQIAMRANEATTDPAGFSRDIAWACYPVSAKLTKGHNTRNGKLNACQKQCSQ